MSLEAFILTCCIAAGSVGVGALIGAIVLIDRRPRDGSPISAGRYVAIGLLLLVALGIGSCFGLTLFR